jgi:hypothetical protein
LLFSPFGEIAKMLVGLSPKPTQTKEDLPHMETQTTTQKVAPRRNRNVTFTIRATPEEKEFILWKMEQSGIGNFNLFALTMLIRGEVKNVDLKHYHELAKEVSRIGANINQVAKFANTNGNLYPQEIAELQERMADIWQLLKSSLSELR